MKMDGEKIINAPKQEVWDALNNPEKLKLAIPGAENVEKKDENNLTATVKTKIGPIFVFTVAVKLFSSFFSTLSAPGIANLSFSGLFKASQTSCLGALMIFSPSIFILLSYLYIFSYYLLINISMLLLFFPIYLGNKLQIR